MDLEKKDWAIIILAVLAVASIAGNGVLLLLPGATERPDLGVVLVFGTMSGPPDLDPMDAWDSAASDVADQVCEPLFNYNLTDPNLAITPALAADFGNWIETGPLPVYQVALRDDVWFHDGTKFDAEAAVWNFERYANLMETHQAKASELYEYYDPDAVANITTGELGVFIPIINSTAAHDDYVLNITCNVKYGPLEAILSFNAMMMLSPASTPFDAPIDTATGDLVGTGPFVYDGYEAGVEVRFHANDYYYKPRAKIDTLIFSIINDAQIRNNALLSGDIDLLDDPMGSMLTTFDTDPDITLYTAAGAGLSVQYLGMNNNHINNTFREVISRALNYSFIITELLEDQAVRLNSCVPVGIQYANPTFDVATFDVAAARALMQGMGYGVGFTTDQDWIDVAEGTSPFMSWNYTYNIGNDMRENMFALLTDNLAMVGIAVEDAGTTWQNFIYSLYEVAGRYRDMVELYWLGWIPDYNDASNYINPLFTNRSIASNGAVYNGYQSAIDNGRDPLALMDNVQLLMEAALLETDTGQRTIYYDRIQQLLVEQDMPWAYGYTGINNDAWNKDVKGYPSNPMGRTYFYPVYWDVASLYEQ